MASTLPVGTLRSHRSILAGSLASVLNCRAQPTAKSALATSIPMNGAFACVVGSFARTP